MSFQPPPTWALPILVDDRTQKAIFNPIWLKWFVDLTGVISSIGSGGTSINHNGLTGLQGGGSSEYYHLTSASYAALTAGFTGTGSLVRATSPTLVTPTLGAASATSVAATGAVSGATVQATTAAGFKSSDGSTGYTGTVTTASLVGKTITIKDGIITAFA